MRLSKVPLVMVGEHLINLEFLTNAYIEKYDSYPVVWRLRYHVDGQTQEDDDGAYGKYVEFKSKKAALEALRALSAATDTLLVEEED